MRIARLIAAGDDRVRRQTTGAQNRGVDFRAQNLRGQDACPTIPAFFPCPASTRFSTSIAARHPGFRDLESACASGASSVSDFASRSGQKSPLAGWSRIFLDSQLPRVTERKICRHERGADPAFSQEMRQHFLVRPGALHLPLAPLFRTRCRATNSSAFACLRPAIDLEIAQNECALAILLEKNKGSARKIASRKACPGHARWPRR